MLTSNRSPHDHFLSAGLNEFYSSQNISQAIKRGAVSFLAIKTSNEIAQKQYANALASGLSALALSKLGETMNPYLHNNYNCPFNPYLNEQNKNNYQQMPMQNNNFMPQNGFNNQQFPAQNSMRNPGGIGGFLRGGNGNSQLIKGVLIGAAVAYLLSNKDAKDTLAKGVAKIQSFASAAIEEFKEQIEDAKASMQ